MRRIIALSIIALIFLAGCKVEEQKKTTSVIRLEEEPEEVEVSKIEGSEETEEVVKEEPKEIEETAKEEPKGLPPLVQAAKNEASENIEDSLERLLEVRDRIQDLDEEFDQIDNEERKIADKYLDNADDLLNEARADFDAGAYEEATGKAKQARVIIATIIRFEDDLRELEEYFESKGL